MKKPGFIFVLFVLLAFGVCLAVPAEDLPETAYDESEGLPYEPTPLLSAVVVQASAQMTKAEPRCDSLVGFDSLTKRCKRRPENDARSHWVPDSLTILHHSLRC
jgi:hypothetical protein